MLAGADTFWRAGKMNDESAMFREESNCFDKRWFNWCIHIAIDKNKVTVAMGRRLLPRLELATRLTFRTNLERVETPSQVARPGFLRRRGGAMLSE